MDDLQQAQALETDTRHGLSQETYLRERGYDPDEEALRRESTRAEVIEENTINSQGQAANIAMLLAGNQGEDET